jgi:hypothetical protein
LDRRYPDLALRGEIVDFVGRSAFGELFQATAIGEVAVVPDQTRILFVNILEQCMMRPVLNDEGRLMMPCAS